METLHNGYTLDVPLGSFPLSTDSMVLCDFIRLSKNATVLDLGSGCGTLGLLLCAKDDTCHVTGLEINTASHLAALENIRRNALQNRMRSTLADLREAKDGNFHVCVSNPPYYTAGPASIENATARRDDLCSSEDLMRAASRALRFGGDFFLVHKPEKLAHLCAMGGKYQLEAKQLRLIRHRENGPVAFILLQFRKGGKPGLLMDERFLFHADGSPSAYYQNVYHLQEV